MKQRSRWSNINPPYAHPGRQGIILWMLALPPRGADWRMTKSRPTPWESCLSAMNCAGGHRPRMRLQQQAWSKPSPHHSSGACCCTPLKPRLRRAQPAHVQSGPLHNSLLICADFLLYCDARILLPPHNLWRGVAYGGFKMSAELCASSRSLMGPCLMHARKGIASATNPCRGSHMVIMHGRHSAHAPPVNPQKRKLCHHTIPEGKSLG